MVFQPSPPPRHPVLNVAGPRGSKVEGIEDKVAAIMVDVLIRMNPDCSPLYPLTQPPEGVDKHQAAHIAQVLTGDEWTVAEVTDAFPVGMQKPYDYRELKEACWFVHLVRSDVRMVGGDSRLVLISQRSGQVVAEYLVAGE
jgi:hypothetical protein